MDANDANIFNAQYAKTLIDDPHAALKIVTSKRRISLLPCYVNKLKTGIKDVLNSELRRYSERLDGLLIAYENIRLINKFGVAAYDEPSIYLEIQGDFIVFQPTVGSTLKGVVNKLGKNHVSCLVHQVFNASLPKPPADEEWLGDDLSVGDEILFKVSHLDLSSRVIFIRGFILRISSTFRNGEKHNQENLMNGSASYDDESDNFVTIPSRTNVLSKDLEIVPNLNMDASESSGEDDKSCNLEPKTLQTSSLTKSKSTKKKSEQSSSSKHKTEKRAKKRKRSTDDDDKGSSRKKKRKDSKKKKKKKEDGKHKKKKKHKQKSSKD